MRERSVSRAAGRLYLGPSAVSMALARLRDVTDDPLFVRAGTGREPTPRALRLWAQLAPALASIEFTLRVIRSFDPATAELTIRFAAPDDLEFVLVPCLLERLATEAPGVRLIVRPSDFRTLLGRLDEGDADLALSATPISAIERRHRVRVLHRESFAVLYDLHGLVDERLAELGRSRQVLAAVAHFPTMPFILKRRRSLANVPALGARYFAAAYGLEISQPPLASPDFDVSLIWHVRTDTDPALRWFRDLVADLVGALT